jgi:hypothetical protein
MSEHSPQPDKSEPTPKTTREIPWTALAGVTLLGGFAVVGIIALNDGPPVHAKHIRAGVPTQVEQRLQPTVRCGYRVGTGGACAQEEVTYKMKLEQCPADVEAARQGQAAESLDRTVGKIGAGCIVEIMQVPESVWQANTTGSIFVFDGPPAKPLHD